MADEWNTPECQIREFEDEIRSYLSRLVSEVRVVRKGYADKVDIAVDMNEVRFWQLVSLVQSRLRIWLTCIPADDGYEFIVYPRTIGHGGDCGWDSDGAAVDLIKLIAREYDDVAIRALIERLEGVLEDRASTD